MMQPMPTEKRNTVTVRLSPEAHRVAKVAAAAEGMTLERWIAQAIGAKAALDQLEAGDSDEAFQNLSWRRDGAYSDFAMPTELWRQLYPEE